MKTKPATVTELVAVVSEHNKLLELTLRAGLHKSNVANPLLDELYTAATVAARSLSPMLNVEVKTLPKRAKT